MAGSSTQAVVFSLVPVRRAAKELDLWMELRVLTMECIQLARPRSIGPLMDLSPGGEKHAQSVAANQIT